MYPKLATPLTKAVARCKGATDRTRKEKRYEEREKNDERNTKRDERKENERGTVKLTTQPQHLLYHQYRNKK